MKRRSRKQALMAEINITPFTDVILVLLIIFMITTPLISQSSLKVNLPQAKSGKQLNETPKQVYITVNSEGLVYMGSELVTRKELKGKVEALYKENPNLEVVLRSDKLVQFKNIVGILDVLNAMGIRNLNIAATQER